MRLLPVRNAGLLKQNKCRPILESFFISAPVAARYFVPKQGFVVSIVHIQINTVHQSRGKRMNLTKHEIESMDGTVERI
jgi:hypothetical protein